MQAIEKPEPAETRQKKFSVLLIDDDAGILTILKHSLAQAGMHTYGFTNPMLAVEHFRRNADTYDIVVTDICMPHMSGFQVARAVKQIRPDIKVAFATSFDINKPEFDKIFPSTEADAFITKPVKPSLSTEISQYCNIPYKGGVIKFEI
jgi:two-component system cell cycle sensor histidine kinase/response regulator CckA